MDSVFDFRKHDVIAWVRAQRARTIALLEDLPEKEWERPVVPGWRVREVAAHLVSTDEAALTGRLLALGLRKVEVGDIEAWNETQVARWAERPIPALLHGLASWGRRLALTLAVTPGPAARVRLPTPFGRVSPLWLGMARVYGEWVHLEDVRRALGLPGDDSPQALEPVARHLLAGIPVQTLPRVPPGVAGAVTLAFTDVDLPGAGYDLGERRFGFAVAGGDARVEGTAAALVMIAARRDPWREAESDGAITISGDRAPAEVFLDSLLLV